MDSRIYFTIAVHAHQPVDNFDHVFAESYRLSYQPFFEVLERFPEIKISLHLSGSLLEWLIAHRIEFIEKIKKMIKHGQIRLLAAGYYEPILTLLNDWDKIGQINLMKERLKEVFGELPTGLWLTERVWEPALPKPLSQAGIKYVIVDDHHFEILGYDIENLNGYYLTEEQGYVVAVFAGSKFLRYSMPFKVVKETIDYLYHKLQSGISVITFADDLEKFGFWPHTFSWVYKEGWLEKFFEELMRNKSWIKLAFFEDILKEFPASGRVYLNCASYSEMMEWSRGMFRNFLARYDEANNIHKKMIFLSKKIKQLEEKHCNEELSKAKKFLYKSQNNDVYWHGIFGGLYLPNLRDNAYRYLIASEKIVEQYEKNGEFCWDEFDFDLDGKNEVIITNRTYKIYISHKGATIFELDYKPKEVNIINTLTRRKEKYHDKLFKNNNPEREKNRAPVSIHDLEHPSHQLAKDLIFDRYRKVCWIEHLFSSAITEEALYNNEFEEQISLYDKDYQLEKRENGIGALFSNQTLNISKILLIKNEMLVFQHQLKFKSYFQGYFGVEFNLLCYDTNLLKGKSIKFFKEKELTVNDEWHRINYLFSFAEEPLAYIYPLVTISCSESGFEKIHQGMSFFFLWPIKGERELELRYTFSLKNLR